MEEHIHKLSAGAGSNGALSLRDRDGVSRSYTPLTRKGHPRFEDATGAAEHRHTSARISEIDAGDSMIVLMILIYGAGGCDFQHNSVLRLFSADSYLVTANGKRPKARF